MTEKSYTMSLPIKNLEHSIDYTGHVELNAVTGEFSVKAMWHSLGLRTLYSKQLIDLEKQFHQLCEAHDEFLNPMEEVHA